MGSERLASFAGQDLLMPIEPLIEADRAAGRKTLDLNDFFENTVNCFRFDGQRTGRGPLYGLPKDFTTVGFYYNKDAFDRADLPYPADDWTWDDFIATASRLGQLDGMIGGAEFVSWAAMIRAYLGTYGLDVINDDFTQDRLLEPAVLARLQTLYDWRFKKGNALTSGKSQVAQGENIFVTGRVGMAGPFGRWVVPTYRDISEFDWDFAPLPRGTQKANLVFTVSWSISKDSAHPQQAWKLVKFLCGPAGQAQAAELGLAIPTLRSVAYGPSFTQPDKKPSRDDVYLSQAEYAKVLPMPSNMEWDARLGTRLEQTLRAGAPLRPTLELLAADWKRDRENPLLNSDYPPVRWGLIATVILVPLALGGLTVVTRWWMTRPGKIALREELSGYAFVSPWVIGFAVFMAFPIVLSLLLSFSKWNGVATLGYAQWVGFKNYTHLLLDDPRFWISLRVTGYYALFAVPLGQVLALAAALLMNHEVRFSASSAAHGTCRVCSLAWALRCCGAGCSMAKSA